MRGESVVEEDALVACITLDTIPEIASSLKGDTLAATAGLEETSLMILETELILIHLRRGVAKPAAAGKG